MFYCEQKGNTTERNSNPAFFPRFWVPLKGRVTVYVSVVFSVCLKFSQLKGEKISSFCLFIHTLRCIKEKNSRTSSISSGDHKKTFPALIFHSQINYGDMQCSFSLLTKSYVVIQMKPLGKFFAWCLLFFNILQNES